jgi:hypothetical protein
MHDCNGGVGSIERWCPPAWAGRTVFNQTSTDAKNRHLRLSRPHLQTPGKAYEPPYDKIKLTIIKAVSGG